MLKKFKKYSKKFFIAFSICFVSILSLFSMTKSYAYEINNNDYLVGNNTLNNEYTTNTIISDPNNNVIYSVINNNPTYTLTFNNTNLGTQTIAINVKTTYYNVNELNFLNMGVLVEFDNTMLTSLSTAITIRAGLLNNNNFVNSYNTQFASINPSTSGKSSLFFTTYNKSYYTITNMSLGFGVYFNNNNQNLSNVNGTMKVTFFIFEQNSNIQANAIDSNQTMVPYSSIVQLQEDYDALLIQYNTLQSAYSQISNDYQTVVDNYNTLQTQYNTLQQQYNTLQSDYSELQNALAHTQLLFNIYVSTHSYTDEEYNTLNNQYQTLQTTYNTLLYQYNNLLVSYNSLQNRYNELLAESTNAMYFALNGATANLYTDVSGTKTLLATDIVSINQNYMNFDNSCIPNINTYLNNYDSSDTTNYPNPYCYIEIELNMSVNSALLFTFDNSILDTDITLSSTISDVTTIYNRKSELNPYQLVVNSDRLSFNRITYDGIYMPDYISIDFSLQLDGYSYSLGYEKGVASQQAYINSLNSSVSTMQASINTLRASNEQLQEQVNNTFGWKNLFFAMADTPFKTVSNVLGFELFGLNLFTTFIGMITVFAIVWLLKKFI